MNGEEFKRPQIELLFAVLPPDGNIVGITVFQERLYVATERRVFMLDGNRLIPIPFEDAA